MAYPLLFFTSSKRSTTLRPASRANRRGLVGAIVGDDKDAEEQRTDNSRRGNCEPW